MKKLLLFLSMTCGIYFSLSAQTCFTPVVDTVTHKSVQAGGISPYASSFTWTHRVSATKGTNTLLVVQVSGDVYCDSVVCGGTLLTRLDSLGNQDEVAETWYRVNPDTGANILTVYYPAGSGTFAAKKEAAAISFYNVDQAIPFGTVAHDTGSTCPSALLVRSGANQLVLDMIVKDYFYSPAAGASQTKVYGFYNANGSAVAGSVKDGADSVTMSWSWTFCDPYPWAAIGIPIMPACVTSVNETQNDMALNVFPNPCSGNLIISSIADMADAEIKIVNALGELVYSGHFSGKQKTISLNVPRGIYSLQLVAGDKQFVKKVVMGN